MNSSERSPVHIYPPFAMIRQRLYTGAVGDIAETVQCAITGLPETNRIVPGESVAIAIGSRGIDRIDQVAHHCIRALIRRGLNPYIVPAMGSHGGATPQGQTEILAKYGITESAMGVPIRPDMETIAIEDLDGLPLHFAATALQADHLVLINRIKPHTKFTAPIESGLCKMLTIGLGKAEGAAAFHRHAVKNGFRIIEAATEKLLPKSKLLFGLALLEDGHGHLAHVEALPPSRLLDREKALLRQAYSWMARIPFDPIDILIIDYIGKDISGIGMDSNITGRHRDITGDFLNAPHPGRIFVRDLSPLSDGNGNGIGLADITTTRLVRSLDMVKTATNAIAAISPEKAAIPIHFDTDREAVNVCLQTIGQPPPDSVRIVRINHTASLHLMQVSKSLEPLIDADPNLERITAWEPLRFDADGNLPPFPR